MPLTQLCGAGQAGEQGFTSYLVQERLGSRGSLILGAKGAEEQGFTHLLLQISRSLPHPSLDLVLQPAPAECPIGLCHQGVIFPM